MPEINCRQDVARASPLMPGIFIERDYAVSVAQMSGRFLDRFAAPCAQTEKSSGGQSERKGSDVVPEVTGLARSSGH